MIIKDIIARLIENDTYSDKGSIHNNISDEEFLRLKQDIEDAMDKLDILQSKYRKLTGKNYAPFR